MGQGILPPEDETPLCSSLSNEETGPILHDFSEIFDNVYAASSCQGERGRHRAVKAANQRPTKTLFVINFDPVRTRVSDIEKHFEVYGKVLNVRIRRNFAFVQFETQEDATKALECTHMR